MYPRAVRITDFLTDREIQEALRLKTAKAICDKIIRPNLPRINRALKQKNDPMFLAYMVEYAMTIGPAH